MTARAKPHPLILTFASSIPPLPPQPTDSTPITPSCFHQHEKRTVLGIYSLLPTVTLFSLSKKLVLQMYDPNQWFKIHFLVMYTFALSGLQNTVLRTTVTFFFFLNEVLFSFCNFWGLDSNSSSPYPTFGSSRGRFLLSPALFSLLPNFSNRDL